MIVIIVGTGRSKPPGRSPLPRRPKHCCAACSRQHLRDIRELDETTGAALMASVARIARAVAAAFPNQGLSVWHSIGAAADQEVPHLHLHVHPRLLGDRLLRVYPSAPSLPDKLVRDGYAAALRSYLDRHARKSRCTGRDAWSVWRRWRCKTLCARAASLAPQLHGNCDYRQRLIPHSLRCELCDS